MPLNSDISTALHLLEHIYEHVKNSDDSKLQLHTNNDLESLIFLLENPVLRNLAVVQDSLDDLNDQLSQHPSLLPDDFDININGQLELSVPTTLIQPFETNIYQELYQEKTNIDDQRVPIAPIVKTNNEDTNPQVLSQIIGNNVIPPITTPTYAKEFQKVINSASKGRQTVTVQLYKPEGTSLGFSVVGLRSNDKGELGIFLQEIQPNGIAGW